MTNARELEKEFWSSLSSDMTMMLGLVGVEESHTRPMTAQLKDKRGDGPIWFFTAKDNTLVRNLKRGGGRAIGTFTSKGHDLFATVHGHLSLDNDPETIDELWNSFVAAWYEGGKDDPNLALLRFDAEKAEIWRNGNSLVAGLMMLFGRDPKRDYKDNVAEVKL
jgi:general stress protein 26